MASPLAREKEAFPRRKFTPEEDMKLRALVESFGTAGWDEIARFLPQRSPRQCRDRYKNYLLETLVTEPWTPEEDALVIRQFYLIGPKWVEIGKMLSGRSGNNVKNRWHKHLAKLKHQMPRDAGFRREIASLPDHEDTKPNINLTQPVTVEEWDWQYLLTSAENPFAVDSWDGMFSFGDSFF
jgi:hypothetical protein